MDRRKLIKDKYLKVDPSQRSRKVIDTPTLLSEDEQHKRETDQYQKWLNHSICYRNDCVNFSKNNFRNLGPTCSDCIDHWEYRLEQCNKFIELMRGLGTLIEALDDVPELNMPVPRSEPLAVVLVQGIVEKNIGLSNYSIKKLSKDEDKHRHYIPLPMVQESVEELALPASEVVEHERLEKL